MAEGCVTRTAQCSTTQAHVGFDDLNQLGKYHAYSQHPRVHVHVPLRDISNDIPTLKNVGRDSILARIHSMLQLWKILSRCPKACFWAKAQLVALGLSLQHE